MALGRKVDQGARTVLGEQPLDQRLVADVAAHEDVTPVAVETREVPQIAGVGELVEVHDRLVGVFEPVEHEVRTDEAGTASDEDHVPSTSTYLHLQPTE